MEILIPLLNVKFKKYKFMYLLFNYSFTIYITVTDTPLFLDIHKKKNQS